MLESTISTRRLTTILCVGALCFGGGFALMAVLNAIGAGLAGAVGAHPSGRGNLGLQLQVGSFLGVLGAAIAAGFTRRDQGLGPRVRLGVVVAAAAVIILVPLVVGGWFARRDRLETVRELAQVVDRGGDEGMRAADTLARTPGGIKQLRAVLNDASRPGEVRLVAGLELVEFTVANRRDLAAVEVLIRRPSPLRATFVDVYLNEWSVGWSDTIERWMVGVLDDPEPTMRLKALSVLISHSTYGPRARQACPALRRLAEDVDPEIRAEAMLRVSACQRSVARAVLEHGARDPAPAVRLAVLRRLAWRIDDAGAAEIEKRRDLANPLLRDHEPAVREAATARMATLPQP